MPLNDPISQISIVEEVISRISESLINHELKPGDRLPSEPELARTLGVGRNSVREAIRMMAASGVLQVRRGNGTFVSDTMHGPVLDPLLYSLILHRGTPFELFELRMMFEVAAVELACQKAAAEDIRACREAIDRLRQAFRAEHRSMSDVLQEDLAFHYAVLAACHNPLIERIGHTVFQLYMNTITKAAIIDPNRTIAGHEAILDVIQKRYVSQARAVVIKSLERWRQVVFHEETSVFSGTIQATDGI